MQTRTVFVPMLFLVSCAAAEVQGTRPKLGNQCNPTTKKNGVGLNIVGGETANASSPVSPFTVQLDIVTPSGGGSLCSGVVASSDIILTASHCFQGGRRATRVTFAVPAGGGLATMSRSVTDMRVNPLYTGTVQGDVAWVRFAGGLPPGVRPATFLSDGNLLSPSPVTLAGFGVTSTHGSDYGVLRFVNMSMDQIYPPGHPLSNLMRMSGAGKNACHGDSGGPAYLNRNGQLLAIGLSQGYIPGFGSNVGADQACESGIVFYTRIDAYLSWFESTTGEHFANQNTPSTIPVTQPAAQTNASAAPQYSGLANLQLPFPIGGTDGATATQQQQPQSTSGIQYIPPVAAAESANVGTGQTGANSTSPQAKSSQKSSTECDEQEASW